MVSSGLRKGTQGKRRGLGGPAAHVGRRRRDSVSGCARLRTLPPHNYLPLPHPSSHPAPPSHYQIWFPHSPSHPSSLAPLSWTATTAAPLPAPLSAPIMSTPSTSCAVPANGLGGLGRTVEEKTRRTARLGGGAELGWKGCPENYRCPSHITPPRPISARPRSPLRPLPRLCCLPAVPSSLLPASSLPSPRPAPSSDSANSSPSSKPAGRRVIHSSFAPSSPSSICNTNSPLQLSFLPSRIPPQAVCCVFDSGGEWWL